MLPFLCCFLPHPPCIDDLYVPNCPKINPPVPSTWPIFDLCTYNPPFVAQITIKKKFLQRSTDEMSPGFWVLLSLDPYVLLGVRNLEEEEKKKPEGVWLYHHTRLALWYCPLVHVCLLVGRRRGRWERERGKGLSPGSGTAYLIPPITVIVC